MAGRLGQPHVPGDYRLKDLSSEKAAKVRRNLLGEGCSVVVHCKENALDRQGRINRTAQAH
jgi:hypothetical protein